MRRIDGLPRGADGRRASVHGGRGAECSSHLLRCEGSGGRPRRGNGAFRGRAAIEQWGAPRAVKVHADSRSQSAIAGRSGAAGGQKPGDLGSRVPARTVLRAGSVEPDCLHDRWQRRGERWRCALPQIRPYRPQRAEAAGAHDRRGAPRDRRGRARRSRLRSARSDVRQRGHARDRHRSHGQARFPNRRTRRWSWRRSTTSARREPRWVASFQRALSRPVWR